MMIIRVRVECAERPLPFMLIGTHSSPYTTHLWL